MEHLPASFQQDADTTLLAVANWFPRVIWTRFDALGIGNAKLSQTATVHQADRLKFSLLCSGEPSTAGKHRPAASPIQSAGAALHQCEEHRQQGLGADAGRAL